MLDTKGIAEDIRAKLTMLNTAHDLPPVVSNMGAEMINLINGALSAQEMADKMTAAVRRYAAENQ